MRIINNTSFPIIAFCFDKSNKCGDDVAIDPGENEEVKGPYLGEMGGGQLFCTHTRRNYLSRVTG